MYNGIRIFIHKLVLIMAGSEENLSVGIVKYIHMSFLSTNASSADPNFVC